MGLAVIDKLADKYSTSFTSIVIRYAPSQSADAHSLSDRKSAIQHFAYSDLFRREKSCFSKQGRPIEINLGDSNSSTEDVNHPAFPLV